ncbi:MAG: mandelate racemase/muconate lactonizing enzyme family protein [candidate division Zixibacteria bacterium]|nr:mandelate racemase/muconate lactonizing enzyme family protein [candidate division Zixibacteria bacterium]
MDALREAVGADYELMVDAHARFDVASAIAGARALEHCNLVWLEEPTHAESLEALKQLRESVNVPLCIGERQFTRWDYLAVLQQRLVEYIMPDVAWCGGISEFRRIAALAESGYIRVSPHDALGPVAIAASFQLCMTIPNLYRAECVHTWFDVFGKIVTPMFDVREGCLFPNNRPGLGIEIIHEEVQRYAIDVDTPPARRSL